MESGILRLCPVERRWDSLLIISLGKSYSVTIYACQLVTNAANFTLFLVDITYLILQMHL